jgi:3-oxoacyl-[acyl-carrier protein] reductase
MQAIPAFKRCATALILLKGRWHSPKNERQNGQEVDLMDMELKGKRALVTGGTRGIGRAIAETLAQEGADVAICARNPDQVADAVASLSGHGGKAIGSAVDVSDKAALKSWIDSAAAELGGLDIVVANVSALADEAADKDWQAGFDIDIMATVHTVNAALPHLKKSEAASVVAISSVSALVGSPVRAYNAVKAAVIAYVSNLAHEFAGVNIRANTVSPGMIYFEDGVWGVREREQPEIFKASLARNPMGRMGTPQEVANAAVFLASPRASFVTGTNLVVDGAITQRVQY